MMRGVGQEGGVQDILATLRGNMDVGDIAQACCGALWSLSVIGESRIYAMMACA